MFKFTKYLLNTFRFLWSQINGDAKFNIPFDQILHEVDPSTYEPLVTKLAGFSLYVRVSVTESLNNITRNATAVVSTTPLFYARAYNSTFGSHKGVSIKSEDGPLASNWVTTVYSVLGVCFFFCVQLCMLWRSILQLIFETLSRYFTRRTNQLDINPGEGGHVVFFTLKLSKQIVNLQIFM